MMLGEFRELLSHCPTDLPVYFDESDTPVGGIISWRGLYSQASLDTGREPRTASDLLKEVDAVLAGDQRQGWKGGDYTYDESTALWADPAGDCPGRMPVSVAHREGKRVTVTTAMIPDEYRY